MAEAPKTKASELVDNLMNRPLTQKEISEREPNLPRLRLRRDTPAIEVADAVSTQDMVSQLQEGNIDALAIHDTGSEAVAVVLPIERYLELAGIELARRPYDWAIAPNGHMAPNESALAASHIEQVDPSETWR